VTGPLLDAARLARRERDLAAYQARALTAELGWDVQPHRRAGRFEATFEGGALIGTADEIRAQPGAALCARRRALALTQKQFAAALGCSRVTLSHAETGRRSPPREWWRRADGMLGADGKLLRLYDAGPEPGPVWPARGD
jgi:DNA-binding transcriptional regulator YiaG